MQFRANGCERCSFISYFLVSLIFAGKIQSYLKHLLDMKTVKTFFMNPPLFFWTNKMYMCGFLMPSILTNSLLKFQANLLPNLFARSVRKVFFFLNKTIHLWADKKRKKQKDLFWRISSAYSVKQRRTSGASFLPSVPLPLIFSSHLQNFRKASDPLFTSRHTCDVIDNSVDFLAQQFWKTLQKPPSFSVSSLNKH